MNTAKRSKKNFQRVLYRKIFNVYCYLIILNSHSFGINAAEVYYLNLTSFLSLTVFTAEDWVLSLQYHHHPR